MAQLAADTEMSVKNGAELLDRLVKDIVSESAASYVSILRTPEESIVAGNGDDDPTEPPALSTAFSLPKFIPLLQERINVINPFTRTFLVSWITLLDSIPDLELVAYLPSFLGGLFKFLSDPNQDVHTQTQTALERFLVEIRKIARIKRGIVESKKSHAKRSTASNQSHSPASPVSQASDAGSTTPAAELEEKNASDAIDSGTEVDSEDESGAPDGDWIPGQDVIVDHPKILDILLTFLSNSNDEEIQLTTLRWIDSFFDISPEDMLQFVPRLLSQVLPAVSNDIDQVRAAANRVNNSLKDYIDSTVEDEVSKVDSYLTPSMLPPPPVPPKDLIQERRGSKPPSREPPDGRSSADLKTPPEQMSLKPVATPRDASPRPGMELDYEGCVNALTLQFLNEHVDTRVAALGWLIMLHHKAPRKVRTHTECNER